MKRFILLIAFISFGFKGFTQTSDSAKTIKKDSIICLCCGSTDPAQQPLWVVNGKVISQLNLAELNPNYIENLNVAKGNDALSKYGPAAKNGVVEILLKKEVKPQSLNKILSKNKIDNASRKLPIYLNGKVIVGDFIFVQSNKKLKIIVIEANLNANKRMPCNGKYLAIIESE